MFAQVISGRTSQPDALRAAGDRWMQELAPGATGWLGSTAGTTEDGRSITIVRFESEEAARRNSQRPEQDQFWRDMEKLYDGEVTFRDSNDVTLDLQGDPDQAGFVQVIEGRGTDPERARELMATDSDKWAEFRPEILGSVSIGHEGGGYTMVLYFISETEAREGERKEVPPELQANMDEMNKLNVGEPEFFNLKEPSLRSPK
jgi:hypothetical protein